MFLGNSERTRSRKNREIRHWRKRATRFKLRTRDDGSVQMGLQSLAVFQLEVFQKTWSSLLFGAPQPGGQRYDKLGS